MLIASGTGFVAPSQADALLTAKVYNACFLSDPDWLNHYGLPQSYGDFGNVFVIRAQRAVFQHWKVDVPWARAGDVTIANGGDVAKEAGLIPKDATTPEEPPIS